MEWWILAPVYVYIMSAFVQTVAGVIGDITFMLLGQAVIALTGIWGLVVFLVWAQAVTIPALVIFGVRACYKSPWRVLCGIFGSEEFRPRDTFTSGMHFFSTEGGITGNTSGPVREKDSLVMVRGCCDYSILSVACIVATCRHVTHRLYINPFASFARSSSYNYNHTHSSTTFTATLRQKDGGFIFIGSAYVGSKARQMIDKEPSEWTKISLY